MFVKRAVKVFTLFFLPALCCTFTPNLPGMKYRIFKSKKVFRVLKNKYFITTILFLVWIIFFDENSLVSQAENKRRLNELNRQKDYYLERIESDTEKLKDLNAGKQELEKFAREHYFMSKPDEDVFIVVEE